MNTPPIEDAPVEPVKPAQRTPWAYVPLLYFMQAIPVTMVQEVSSVIYKDLGVNNLEITRWTSLIAIPWTIKLLWGPLVDLNLTKRRWLLGMQALIALTLSLVAFFIATPKAFQITLGLLFATAIFSATCDIATDGFYLLALDKDHQAAFVGIQSTCYRLGRLFCIGGLVWFEGRLYHSGVNTGTAWLVAIGGGALIYALGRIIVGYSAPRPEADIQAVLAPGENYKNALRTFTVLLLAVSSYFSLSAIVRLAAQGLWATIGSANPNGFLKGWMLPPGGPIKEMVQLALCLFASGALFVATQKLMKDSEMGAAFSTFFRQKGIAAILAFIFFYRFGEAMVLKMSQLFLKDPVVNGGLAVNNEQLGLINGVAGVLGLVLGGLVGGLFVSKRGLRGSFWFIAISMHLPNLLYLWAAITRPPVWTLYGVSFVDQFGYGFGYAGYIVYLMRVAQRSQYRTAHYAIATGLGALCIMTAGIFSGIVQMYLGYIGFFSVVMFAAIPGMLTLLWIPLDETV